MKILSRGFGGQLASQLGSFTQHLQNFKKNNKKDKAKPNVKLEMWIENRIWNQRCANIKTSETIYLLFSVLYYDLLNNLQYLEIIQLNYEDI